jgi:hypothetical protein
MHLALKSVPYTKHTDTCSLLSRRYICLKQDPCGLPAASSPCASQAGSGDADTSSKSRVPEGTLDAVLRRQLPALLRVAQPTHAVTLAALSIVEAYIVSRSELPASHGGHCSGRLW